MYKTYHSWQAHPAKYEAPQSSPAYTDVPPPPQPAAAVVSVPSSCGGSSGAGPGDHSSKIRLEGVINHVLRRRILRHTHARAYLHACHTFPFTRALLWVAYLMAGAGANRTSFQKLYESHLPEQTSPAAWRRPPPRARKMNPQPSPTAKMHQSRVPSQSPHLRQPLHSLLTATPTAPSNNPPPWQCRPRVREGFLSSLATYKCQFPQGPLPCCPATPACSFNHLRSVYIAHPFTLQTLFLTTLPNQYNPKYCW
jgi:hypothetical protein